MAMLSDEVQHTYYGLCGDPKAAAGYLATQLDFPRYQTDARSSISLDFCINILENAKRLRLSQPKTAAFFQIAQTVMTICKGGQALQDAEDLLRSSLMALCRANPQETDAYLSPDQIAHVASFFVSDVFRNFRLYAYVFEVEQAHTSYHTELLVETPVVPSFDKAMSEAEWSEHQALVTRDADEKRAAAEQLALGRLEEDRLRMLQDEREQAERAWAAQLALKPATLEEAVEHLVSARLDQEKSKLEEQYKFREQALQQQIAQLQSKLPA